MIYLGPFYLISGTNLCVFVEYYANETVCTVFVDGGKLSFILENKIEHILGG
jgi:hypothetical protein